MEHGSVKLPSFDELDNEGEAKKRKPGANTHIQQNDLQVVSAWYYLEAASGFEPENNGFADGAATRNILKSLECKSLKLRVLRVKTQTIRNKMQR